jgi:hypothetical protein
MSLHDYDQSKYIDKMQFPFYAIIMAAMRQADTDNATRLKVAFPAGWVELQARYNAPGGELPGDGPQTMVVRELQEFDRIEP